MTARGWFAAMIGAAVAGIVAEFVLLTQAVVEPGFEGPPANWFQAVVGLALPIHVVVVHVRGNLPIILTLLATVITIAVLSRYFVASLPQPRRAAALVGAQIAIGLVLTAVPVAISSDPYAYMLIGQLWAKDGINLYAQNHAFVGPADPIAAHLAHFFGNPLPWGDEYGPLFTQAAGAIAKVANGNLHFEYMVYRVAGVLAAATVTLALLRLLRPRSDAIPSAARFAFNPLVLLETAVNGHNDMFMVAFAVSAFAVVDELPIAAGILLGVSIGIKFVSVIVLPFLLAIAARRGIARTVPLVVGLATVLVAAFAPFWVGLRTVGAVAKGYQCFFSPSYMVNVLLFGPEFENNSAPPFAYLNHVPVLRHATAPQLVSLCFIALFAVGIVVLLVRFIRRRRIDEFCMALVGFVWATPIFNPWYFVWLAPVTAWRGPWPDYARYLTWASLAYYPLLYGIANGEFDGLLPFFVTGFVFIVPAIVMEVTKIGRNGTPGLAPIRASR